MVDQQINKFLTQKLDKNIAKEKDKFNLFYLNQKHKNSHIDEKIIKKTL